MGRDKALLPVSGSKLLLWQRQLAVLEELQPEMLLWSGSPRPGMPNNVSIIPDAVNDSGPLAGVAACLAPTQPDLLIVLAIDLPAMTSPFLRRLLAESSPTCGAAAIHNGF